MQMAVIGVKRPKKFTHRLSFSKIWLKKDQKPIWSQNIGQKWAKNSENWLVLQNGPLDLILTDIFVISRQFRSRKVLSPKHSMTKNWEQALFCRVDSIQKLNTSPLIDMPSCFPGRVFFIWTNKTTCSNLLLLLNSSEFSSLPSSLFQYSIFLLSLEAKEKKM